MNNTIYHQRLVAQIHLSRDGRRKAIFTATTGDGWHESPAVEVDAALLAGVAAYAEANALLYTERFAPGSELGPTEIAAHCIVLTQLFDAGLEPENFAPALFAEGGVGPELKVVYRAAEDICRGLVQ